MFISGEQHRAVSSGGMTNDTLQDAELVLAAKAGSHEAFEALQDRYRPRLHRRLLLVTRNREDAEDALQDAFLRAYMALGSFEGRSKFSSWITRIAINSALMILRKRRRRGEVDPGHEAESGNEPSCFDIPDSGPNPEQIYDQHQRCLKILRAIHNLDSKMESVIRIELAQECSISEVAQTLNVSVSAAKTRLHRARRHLRRSLERRPLGPWPDLHLEGPALEFPWTLDSRIEPSIRRRICE